MKTVLVITNNEESYRFFLKELYPPYKQGFRFAMVAKADALKSVLLAKGDNLFTCLSHYALHRDRNAIIVALMMKRIPNVEPYDFTHYTEELQNHLVNA